MDLWYEWVMYTNKECKLVKKTFVPKLIHIIVLDILEPVTFLLE